MKIKQSFVSINSFSVYLNVFTGLWMSNFSSIVPSFAARVALYAFNIFSDTCVMLAFLSFLSHQFIPDISVNARCIGVFSTIITFQAVAKSLYFFVYRKKFQKFIEMWEGSHIRSSVTEEGHQLLAAERRNVKLISLFLLAVLASPPLFWDSSAYVPALQELHGGRFIPVPGYFPYDALSSPWFEFTLAFEGVAGWLMMAKIVAFDTFFFTLASQEVVHLKTLKTRLEKMFDIPGLDDTSDELVSYPEKRWKPSQLGSNSHNSSNRDSLVDGTIEPEVFIVEQNNQNVFVNRFDPDRKIKGADARQSRYHIDKSTKSRRIMTEQLLKTQMKLWIQDHQEIIRLVAEINDLYSPILLIQFFTSILILCFSAFVCVEVDSLDGMQYFAVYLNTISQWGHLFLLCHYGDRIAEASVSLSDAGLANGWHACRVKEVLTSMKIVYQRVQIPLQISAVRVFPLTAETFVGITRIAISYLMFLIDIKKKP